jgi:hypothetical protein
MTVTFGNLLTGHINTGAVTTPVVKPAISTEFKKAPYTAIAYERQPVVTDTVPTKHADGTPFWSDYVTPNKVWTC